MEHTIFLNGKQVKVIAYFMFESTRNHYLIYSDIGDHTTIYLGRVREKDGVYEVSQLEKTYSFIMKKLIQELINKDLTTVRGYRYFNELADLQDNFSYLGSQKIVLEPEKKETLEQFIDYINQNNDEILEKAKEEYYLQLVEEKAKERRTIIILLIVLIVTISLIAKMILDFLH